MSTVARLAASLIGLLLAARTAGAQDNYEIQVYGAETVHPGWTMVELHSNYTADGSTSAVDGVLPDQHAWHETLEVTQGITAWSELGLYLFTSYRTGEGYQWVGDHIRPRVRIPAAWHWPVNASLSFEIGYERRTYAPDTWSLEIRPILDTQRGAWYLALNPTLDRSLAGAGVTRGVTFAPDVKISYALTGRVAAGLEYYGSLGPVTGLDPLPSQQQSLMPALDLDFGPDWEFNAAVGVGLTASTDRLLVKMIVGRRLRLTRLSGN